MLESRPFHGDEANQAVKAGVLLDKGEYKYDPQEHHGPTLYYAALVAARATGVQRSQNTTEFTFRIVPVFFGVGVVLLLIPLRSGLGPLAALYAAILLAVSPAFVFYSRYFIQEMLLVFFTAALIVFGYRYSISRRLPWAIAAGAAAGFMHATKETAVIAWMAMTLALAATWAMGRYGNGKKSAPPIPARTALLHSAAALLVATAVSITLFTSFFTYAQGARDSILTYTNYLVRAGGAGIHEKPWYYYLKTLLFVRRGPGPWWSEGFILASALLGIAVALRRKTTPTGHSGFLKFLALYTLAQTILYAAIPYKTPWTMLSFYFGAVLMAGVGLEWLTKAAPSPALRTGVILIVAAATAHLCLQTYRANGAYAADPRNPYVYAHTSSAFMRLVERAEAIAQVHPEKYEMLIRVLQPDRDYWPLPWYLRKFSKVGYWEEVPQDADAALIIASPKLHDEIQKRLTGQYTTEIHALRPAVLRTLYIQNDLWEAYMAGRR